MAGTCHIFLFEGEKTDSEKVQVRSEHCLFYILTLQLVFLILHFNLLFYILLVTPNTIYIGPQSLFSNSLLIDIHNNFHVAILSVYTLFCSVLWWSDVYCVRCDQ
jgi:hypothetical protein